MEMLSGVLFAFMSAAGFAVLFNIPRRSIVGASFCGAAGWYFYLLLINVPLSPIWASFSGALVIGLLGEIFAKISKKPATIYVIPGIIVLVPGYGFYESMHLLTQQKYMEATRIGSEAFFIAIAIACGIILATSIMKIFNPRFRKPEQD